MIPIKISATGAQAQATQKPALTSGTVGLTVEFTFDESWEGLTKTAVFRCGNNLIPPVLCQEDCAEVPWEALEIPGYILYVGVYGTDDQGNVLPTVWAKVDKVEPGATIPDVQPSERTQTAYEQILEASREAVEVANSVREDADNGKFKGDKGDKGDPGVVKFKVVNELPEQGTDDAIYLVPVSDGTDSNMYDEYIFVDGVWERIGSTAVEVDLTDYVKKTDYAALDKAGVVKTKSAFGILTAADGYIYAVPAWDSEIDTQGSSSYRTLQPRHISKIVKVGLTDNKEAWSEEEQAAARALLGTIEAKTSDRTSVYAVNSSGEQILVGTCSNAVNSGMIPVYSGNGNISVNDPTGERHAANKGYVDGLVGDIETALDSIIALQNQHIGGESV